MFGFATVIFSIILFVMFMAFGGDPVPPSRFTDAPVKSILRKSEVPREKGKKSVKFSDVKLMIAPNGNKTVEKV